MDEYDLEGAAKFLGVSNSTLLGIIKSGMIVPSSSNPIRISKRELVRYLRMLLDREETTLLDGEKEIKKRAKDLLTELGDCPGPDMMFGG